MNLRPLDHVLPGRAAASFIRLRGRAGPALQLIAADLARAWRLAQPWLAGAALVLGILLVEAWMRGLDRENDFDSVVRALDKVQAENQQLRGELAEASAMRAGSLFYLIEGNSIKEVGDKLNRLSLNFSQVHHDLVYGTKESAR